VTAISLEAREDGDDIGPAWGKEHQGPKVWDLRPKRGDLVHYDVGKKYDKVRCRITLLTNSHMNMRMLILLAIVSIYTTSDYIGLFIL
jgi:hypothetical protein